LRLGFQNYSMICQEKAEGNFRTWFLNKNVDRSGVMEVDMTLFTTTSTIKYL
jgi:hypothetical protein